MSKVFALMFVLVFLTASCVVMAEPVSGASAVGDSWVEKAPMHEARGYLGLATLNGKIYAIGGSRFQVSQPVGFNEEYDPVNNTWTSKLSMPSPRCMFATAVYDNKIFCIGGFGSNGSTTGLNEVYDPGRDSWETKTPMPTRRAGLTANVVDGKIYLIGGGTRQYYGYVFNVTEVYDPATDTWTTKASIPTAAMNYASAVFNDKIYVVGGNYENTNQIYDPKTDTWTSGSSSPGFYEGVGGATLGVTAPERIYCFSWGNANEIYDAKNDSWTYGTQVPPSSNGFAVASLDDQFYVIGGINVHLNWGVYVFKPLSETDTPLANNMQYVSVGYGTVPPSILISSPESNNYTSNRVSLDFTLNKPVNWTAYSLDGKQNVTITGNTTVPDLSNGFHNITVYAEDMFGNMGASESVIFKISLHFPTTTVAVVSGVLGALVVAGLLVFLKRRKH